MRKFLLILSLLFLPITPLLADEGLDTYYDLATKYLGQPGDCFYMATKYLRDLYNDANFSIGLSKYNETSYASASPGDVIYYDSCASARYEGGYTTH